MEYSKITGLLNNLRQDKARQHRLLIKEREELQERIDILREDIIEIDYLINNINEDILLNADKILEEGLDGNLISTENMGVYNQIKAYKKL